MKNWREIEKLSPFGLGNNKPAFLFESVKIEVVPFKSYSSVGKTLRKNRYAPALLAKKELITNLDLLYPEKMKVHYIPFLEQSPHFLERHQFPPFYFSSRTSNH